MRKLVLLLSLISPIVGFSQTFEGKITYANSYKSKIPQLKDQQLGAMMGTIQDYYIKGADYKSVINGTFVKMQLYRSDENRSYGLTAKSDSLYWEDYSKNKDVAIKYEIERGKETIMGMICDVIIVYTSKSKTYYYYNNKYAVSPGLFTKHEYGNWYYIISKTKALPLKTIYEDDQLVLTSTAVNIIPMQLGDNIFAIPDKSKIAAAKW